MNTLNMTTEEFIEKFELAIKEKIKNYGQRKFAQDYYKGKPDRKILTFETDICNFLKDRRTFSLKKLFLINDFFSSL